VVVLIGGRAQISSLCASIIIIIADPKAQAEEQYVFLGVDEGDLR